MKWPSNSTLCFQTAVNLWRKKIYNYTQRGTTKANSALKIESPKCHPPALKLPGSLCFSTLVAHKKPQAEHVAFRSQFSMDGPLGEETHSHKHKLRQSYTVAGTHATHTWRSYTVLSL